MKFEKRNFMGIELDVLVGHPEHELLFVATQVARAAGLKNPSQSASRGAVTFGKSETLTLGSIPAVETLNLPSNSQCKSWLFNETATYRMLLAGRAPQSEPFRKWVTEEVLPTIRKTGKYNAEESSNPIAVGLMDELKALRGEVGELKALIQGLSLGQPVEAVVSPYEGVTKGTVWYHKNVQAIRKAGETLRLSAPVVDKYTPHLLIQIEKNLIQKWKESDPRRLDSEFSTTGARNWTLWPLPFLKSNTMHHHLVEALTTVINEKLNK